MRILCPLCGSRDRREFYYYGAEDYLHRPEPGAAPEAWDNYLHLRDNPAGITRDLWYHETGCASWIVAVSYTHLDAVPDLWRADAPARWDGAA